MKTFRFFLLLCVAFMAGSSPAFAQVKWNKVKVLVYTKNGKGFIHDNLAASVECIRGLSRTHGFALDVSDDPAVFTDADLAGYDMLMFTSTNNDVFDNSAQRLAFRRYIESGGGFVGLHSVMGTERNWTWFKNMLGGTFAWHAVNQLFRIRNIRPDHPSMQGMPAVWEKKDECYFSKEMYPGIEVLMAHEVRSLDRTKQADLIDKHTGPYNELYPAVWYHRYDGGHVWITALGHDIFNYTDPLFVNHVFRGMEHIATLVKKRDPRKAYATDRDAPLQ